MKRSALILSTVVMAVYLLLSGMITESYSQPKPAEKMNLDEFTAVYVAIPAKVYLAQGKKHDIMIDADQKTLDKIVVEVNNGKLEIKPESPNTRISSNVKVYITLQDVEKIALAGSGDIICEDRFKAGELKLSLAGSGLLDFNNLEAEEMKVNISGSGNMLLKGKGAEEMKISLAGSGDLDAVEFPVEELKCSISGSGKCEVFITGEIDATIAGSGKVMYRGEAEVNSRVAGSGKVAKIN